MEILCSHFKTFNDLLAIRFVRPVRAHKRKNFTFDNFKGVCLALFDLKSRFEIEYVRVRLCVCLFCV